MAGNVKVDTQKLRATAAHFANTRNQVKSTTNNMMNVVHQLSGTRWSGDNASQFVAKFNDLSDEIKAIDNMLDEHAKDLEQMAAEYDKAEQTIAGENSKLKTQVF